MVVKSTEKELLNEDHKLAIKDKFDTLSINDFLRSSIAQDGGNIAAEFPEYIGMRKPGPVGKIELVGGGATGAAG